MESWPLRPTPSERPTIETRVSSFRQLYNGCLKEAPSRSAKVKADPEWSQARSLPLGDSESTESKAHRQAFGGVRARHDFSRYEMQTYGSSLSQSWVRDHVPAQEAQAVARRAFEAVNRYYKGLRSGVPGPSVADVVHDTSNFTVHFAQGVDTKQAELRGLQRRLNRQHRAGSPSYFHPDGTRVKGVCHWQTRPRSALRTRASIADLLRKISEHRKSAHGQLWNQIRAIDTEVRLEKSNYVSWQKALSRSVRDKTPGLFVGIGNREAESAGGTLFEFSTYTALSQSCICGKRAEKRLLERTHCCTYGVVAQRDRFSAFLGLYVYRQVDTETGNVQDLLDVEGAKVGFLHRHDISSHPASGSKKPQGSQPRSGSHSRAVSCRKAMLCLGGDRMVRGKPAQPVPTVQLEAVKAGAV